jgi:hypothetical protein
VAVAVGEAEREAAGEAAGGQGELMLAGATVDGPQHPALGGTVSAKGAPVPAADASVKTGPAKAAPTKGLTVFNVAVDVAVNVAVDTVSAAGAIRRVNDLDIRI